MSLYHETAGILTAPGTQSGSLKSRIYGSKDLKSPQAQVYALAFEASKWSAVLKEVVESSQLLQKERKLTPALSILLAHDLLLAKKGIALPASHGLRTTIEKHKARLQSEFTRARIRRKCPTLDALKAMVDAELGPVHPRWIRVNTLKSTVDDQLDTSFKGYEMVPTVEAVIASASTGKKVICLDGHVPNLIAAPPGADFSKTEAYKTGAIIFQDKASCFPAYLLDPRPEDGDIIDACSAPGNKTTHLAGILHERGFAPGQRILAFEKDPHRAKTLAKMIGTAGTDHVTVVHAGQDFLQTDPQAPEFKSVGALLLDPSCSGSGIVGRDDTPPFHLPGGTTTTPPQQPTPSTTTTTTTTLKRKRPHPSPPPASSPTPTNPPSAENPLPALQTRLASLAAFQLSILLHAFHFPSARKVTYSTCSIHSAENECVVRAALAAPVAKQRGWRVLRREEQVSGMREWPVRGEEVEDDGEGMLCGEEVVGGCIRARRGDGRGVMGFFVVCFVRDGGEGEEGEEEDRDGPYVRDGQGRIVRGPDGMPTLKSTGRKVGEEGSGVEVRFGGEGDGDEGPFERDAQGRIVRGPDGMPKLKGGRGVVGGGGGDEEDEDQDEEYSEDDDEDDEDEEGWGGFDD